MVVDVEGPVTTYGEAVRRIRTEALLALRQNLLEFLETHPDKRDELMADLKRMRTKFEEAGDEESEDLVLDAMDMLTGGVRPEMRV